MINSFSVWSVKETSIIFLPSNKEKYKEDRKDSRTDKQATQQSRLISQRKKDLPPVDFNKSGDANQIMNNLSGQIAPENM